MSPGAIAGTVIGVVAGLLLCALIARIALKRRRNRGNHKLSEDLDGEVEVDAEATPYIAPGGSSSPCSVQGGTPTAGKPPRPPLGEPRHIVHHEEDAGAYEAETENVVVSVLPPVYREEWNGSLGESSNTVGFPRFGQPADQAARETGAPADGAAYITQEEIKYLGPPVTTQTATAPSLDSQSAPGITPEEIKYLGRPFSTTGPHT